MCTFTDLAGRVWRLKLHVSLAQQIRDALGVDFLNAHDGKALQQLGRDDELLVKTLWMICEEQAQKADLSPESFVAELGGNELEEACTAIEEAVLVFTRPAKRPVLEAVRQRAAEVTAKTNCLAIAKVNGPTVDRAIERELEKAERAFDQELSKSTANSSPTNGPESSALTPGPSA